MKVILDGETALRALIGAINAAATDSLHGKLGTDTELADNSLYDLLGGNAFKTHALSVMLGALTATDNLKGILGAYTTSANLKAAIDAIATDADPKVMGRLQVASKAWDGRPGEGAGTDTIFTATDQAVVVEAIIVVITSVDLTTDDWTGLGIHDNYGTTPHTFISQADGVKANLTINAQLAWTGSVYLAQNQIIQAEAYGNDADEDALITIVALYRAVVAGGYLA